MPSAVVSQETSKDIGASDQLRAAALGHTHDRKWNLSAETWKQILDSDPENWEAAYRLCEASFHLNNVEDAIKFGEQAQRMRPGDLRPLHYIGRCRSRQREFELAEEIWQRLVQDSPSFYEAWFRLGQSQSENGRHEESIESINRALELAPLNPAAYSVIGQVAKRLPSELARSASLRWVGIVESAQDGAGLALLDLLPRFKHRRLPSPAELAVINKSATRKSTALKENATSWEDRLANARAYFKAGNWADSARAWLQLTKMKPRDFEAHYRLGQSWNRLDESTKALRELEVAFRLRPAHIGNLSEFTNSLFAGGKEAEALETWRNAIAASPRDVNLRVAYTSFLDEIGRDEGVKSAAADALDLIDEPNRNALLMVRRLSNLDHSAQIVSSLDRICRRDNLELDRDRLELIARYALALEAVGRSNEAHDWLKFADTKGACFRMVVRNRIRMLANLDQMDEAQEVIDSTLTREPGEKWAWIEAIDGSLTIGRHELVAHYFSRACEVLDLSLADWLDLAERAKVPATRTAILGRARTQQTKNPDLLVRLAKVSFQHGDCRVALDLLQRAAQLSPDDVAIKKSLVEVAAYDRLFARYGIDQDKIAFPDTAFELIERHLREFPKQPFSRENTILMVNSSLGGGGAERQIVMTLGALSQIRTAAFELHLCCRRLSGTGRRDIYLDQVKGHGVRVVDLETDVDISLDGLSEVERRIVDLFDPDLRRTIASLYSELVKTRPQVVHLWQDRTNLAGAVAAALAGIPRIVLSCRSTRPRTRQRYRSYMLQAYLAVMKLPGVVLSNNSQAGARDYAEWLDMPCNEIEVIWNGFNFDALLKKQNPITRSEVRKAAGIPENALVVGGVFRIAQVKRPLLWADTAAEVIKQLPDVHFVVAGEGPMRENMVDRLAQLGISDQVHLLGHVEVGLWYRAMDALLLTSETEGLPNVVIEAQAAGVPVVSTKVGGILEIIEEGSTGYTADGTPSDLSSRLLDILRDAEWRMRARDKATRTAQERFGVDSMVRRTLQVYFADAEHAPSETELLSSQTTRQPLLVNSKSAEARARLDLDRRPRPQVRPMPPNVSKLLERGIELFKSNHLEQCRELFSQALRNHPRHSEAQRWLARTLRGLGDLKEAIIAWKVLLRSDPNDREAHIRILEALVRGEMFDEAIAFSGRAVAAAADDVQTLRLLAQSYLARGLITEALANWDRLLEIAPEDFEALYRSGEALLTLERYDAAEARLSAAAKHPRNDPRPALLLARHWSWVGRVRDARTLLRGALIKAPRHPDIWRTIFDLIRSTAAPHLADRVIRRAETTLGSSLDDELFFAELLLADGRIVQATSRLEALLGIPEARARAIQQLGTLALRFGDISTAEQLLRSHRTSQGAETLPELAAKVAESRNFLERFEGTPSDSWPSVFLRTVDNRHSLGTLRQRARPGVILHVLNSLAPGGTERQCTNVAIHQATDQQKREVWVVRTDPRSLGRSAFFIPALTEANVHTTTLTSFPKSYSGMAEANFLLDPPAPLRSSVNVREVAALVAAIQQIRPEIVQAWTPQCCAHVSLAGLLCHVPRIVLRGGSVAPDSRALSSELDRLRAEWQRSALRLALSSPTVSIVNNCAHNLADWLRWLGVKPGELGSRARVVPNLLDLPRMKTVDPLRLVKLRQDLRISDRCKIVGGVMRFEQEKDPELWIDTAAQIARQAPDVRFLLIGDGRLLDRIQRKIRQLGLDEYIILTGTQADGLVDFYGLFDAFLLTSHFEGLPNVLLEAQFYGVPVVAPNVGGIPEAMQAGTTGLLATDREAAALAKAVLCIIGDAAVHARMSDAARKFAVKFSPEAILANFDAVYYSGHNGLSPTSRARLG